MKGILVAIAAISLAPLALAASAYAAAEHTSRICLGHDALLKIWGPYKHYQLEFPEVEENYRCPAHHALFGLIDPGGKQGPASIILLTAVCCPLPAEDILLEQHVQTLAACPEGHVVTGMSVAGCSDCEHAMRCTKVNSARYRLGESRGGAYWGIGYNVNFGKEDKLLLFTDLPIAIRYGLARRSRFEFYRNGCVGDPPGSLLVEKQTKYCRDFRFRELQYRGSTGDPKRGTALEMYPSCKGISDIFDPEARCIQ